MRSSATVAPTGQANHFYLNAKFHVLFVVANNSRDEVLYLIGWTFDATSVYTTSHMTHTFGEPDEFHPRFEHFETTYVCWLYDYALNDVFDFV